MKKINLFYIAFLSLTFSLSAQTIVYTGAGNKHVVFEQWMGNYSPNFQAGETVMSNILAANPGVIHRIGYTPFNSDSYVPTGTVTDFRRSFLDAFYDYNYANPNYVAKFMPAAFINRQTISSSNIDIYRKHETWTAKVDKILTEACPLNVGLKSVYNATAQTLTIDVEVYYTSTVTVGNSLYVFISEDSLTSNTQTETAANSTNPYVYSKSYREHVSVGQWGDTITGPTTKGSLYTTQYIFDLSGTIEPINVANAHVLAFVIEDNTNKEVYTGLNVVADGGQGSTGTPVITELNEFSNTSILFNISPNPTEGDVNIIVQKLNSTSQLDVINVLGEVVYSENLNTSSNQTINLQADIFTSKGIYFVRITNSENSVTKKIISK